MNPRFPLVLLGLGIVSLVGCNEYKLVEDPDNIDVLDDSLYPDIAVDPTSIVFGQVSAGGRSPRWSISSTRGRRSSHPGHLAGRRGCAFDIGAVGSILVPPGSSTNFTSDLPARHTANTNSAVLIESDDPDEPTTAVTLIGDGIAPVIEVSPVAYDFGNLYVGCEQTQSLTVSNTGNANLEVTDFSFNTAADLFFDADETTNGALPLSIAGWIGQRVGRLRPTRRVRGCLLPHRRVQ